jgi:hypothetical protein
MQITIAQRMRPFSHLPGTRLVIPGTALTVECFPALLRIYGSELLREIPLALAAPPTDYTVCQDLEAGCVRIWQQSEVGFVRYRLQATPEGELQLVGEKGPQESLSLLTLPSPPRARPAERLSLGSHRALDWQRVWRDRDLAAILPVWLRLGQWVPPPPHTDHSGTAALLLELTEGPPEHVCAAMQRLLKVGFEGLLCPRLIDRDHQGFSLSAPTARESPLVLLSEGARRLRALFVRHEGRSIELLPKIPPEFHCGRFTGLHCQGTLHFEWTKKQLRRMVFHPEQSGEWRLQFPKELRSYRLRQSMTDRGVICNCQESIVLEKDLDYMFDKFEK